MSRLTRIQIDGFRSLKQVALEDLGPVSVLIGPNGSGKSNLLEALRLVTFLASRGLSSFVAMSGGAADLLHYGPKTTPELKLRLDFETDTGSRNAYEARLAWTVGDSLVFVEERAGFQKSEDQDWQWTEAGSGHTESAFEVPTQDPAVRTLKWMLDEPELGLHPAALGLFCDLVRSASFHCQVMLATQSSALLNHFEPDEIIVTERRLHASSFRRLSSGDLAAWLKDYELADLYDGNLLGGRP